MSRERACKFGQLPRALVYSGWTPEQTSAFDAATQTKGPPADTDDGFWTDDGAEVGDGCVPFIPGRSFSKMPVAAFALVAFDCPDPGILDLT